MIRNEWANAHPKISSMFTYKSVTLILQQNKIWLDIVYPYKINLQKNLWTNIDLIFLGEPRIRREDGPTSGESPEPFQ
jgi:hypothetical protein